MKELLLIAIGSALVNNVVLSQFLGLCPFLGVSKKVETSAGLCTYPLTVSYKNGDLVEIKNKQGFLALGSEIIFSRAMRNAVASTNVAKLVSVGKAGAQMGDDCGLSLYKVGGKWKAGYFYLDAAGSSDQQAVDISSLSEMAEQIQKTFSYKSLDTLAMMCNYPMVMTYANGTSQEIQTPAAGLTKHTEISICINRNHIIHSIHIVGFPCLDKF